MTIDPDVERRLAAVAFVDVADFSRLMELDDVQTMLKWKILRRELLEPKLAEHRGRLLRAIGDSLFVEFRSAVDAVRWADAVQRGIGHIGGIGGGESLRVRIGINVEDVIVDGDDVLGDGVNIAARIQRLAEPGETFLTAAVHDYVWNKAGLALVDLGERELKNISRPVQLYKLEHSSEPETARPRSRLRPVWSSLPSIAVLPFRNLGGNMKEDYFGEGMTEDIIAALARSRSLFVIARNSTLRYRDGPADAKQIASELGVRYLLEGSVRRQSQRLRISADLIDARLNRTIWADRYDGTDDDLFEFQDRIASSIVATIEQWLYQSEAERVRSKPTGSLDAYDCVLRAMPLLHAMENVAFQRAAEFLDRAIELDPAYSQAHAYKAWLHLLLIGEARSKDVAADAGCARDHTRRAMEIDPNDPFVLAVAGHVQGFLHKQPEFAAKLFDRAIELNENSAFAWGLSVLTYCYLSKPDEALERFSRAWRLSPFDPLNYFYLFGAGMAEFLAGRYEQALPWLHKALRVNGRFLACHRQLTTCLAHLGRLAEARAAAAEVLALEPSFRVSTFASWYPLRPPENLERYVAGLRMAGLPE
jgi:adenylate cyclase